MRKNLIWGLTLCAAMGVGVAMQAKDPVVMTVNGQPVYQSEFEYLYFKNLRQQAELQPLDEYAEVFKIYKLKVADALAMGLDTTAAFQRDYDQYRKELAQPYLTDSAYIKQLAAEAYDRTKEFVSVSHIMFFKSPDAQVNRRNINTLDSLRSVIAAGGDFASLAAQYSQDRGSSANGGDLGFLPPLHYPYAFETAAYNLKEGELSGVVESPMAYHIILGGKRMANPGKVSASHILKMVPRNATPAQEAAAKAQIDSIYEAIVADPLVFEELAVKKSDDRGSARNGGLLPPFYPGEMIPEFSQMAFSLADGQISQPFRTQYGWHIIKRFSMRPPDTYAKMEPRLIQAVTHPGDIRSQMVADHQRQALGKEFGLKRNNKAWKIIDSYIAAHGVDSLFVENITRSLGNKDVLYTYGKGEKLTFSQLSPMMAGYVNTDPELAAKDFEHLANSLLGRSLIEYKEITLMRTNPDYANLVREFYDGSLLFEAGRMKVWDKASTDTVGLNRFFEEHRAEYAWQQPRAKGWMVYAASDSLAKVAKAALDTVAPAQYVPLVRKYWPGEVVVEQILTAQGANPMVDFLAFGGPEVKSSNTRLPVCFLYNVRVIAAPEEVSDVRGLVISDYQNQLETEWVEEIKDKYPVTINMDVLRKIKTPRK